MCWREEYLDMFREGHTMTDLGRTLYPQASMPPIKQPSPSLNGAPPPPPSNLRSPLAMEASIAPGLPTCNDTFASQGILRQSPALDLWRRVRRHRPLPAAAAGGDGVARVWRLGFGGPLASLEGRRHEWVRGGAGVGISNNNVLDQQLFLHL